MKSCESLLIWVIFGLLGVKKKKKTVFFGNKTVDQHFWFKLKNPVFLLDFE